MVAYLLYIGCILAVLHLIYDGIIAPNLRAQHHFRLAANLARLEHYKRSSPSINQDPLVPIVEEMIHSTLRFQSVITIFSLVKGVQISMSSPELKAAVKERIAIARSSEHKEVREVYRDVQYTAVQLAVVNVGGLFLYLMPIGPPIWVAVQMVEAVRKRVRRSVEASLVVPPEQLDTLYGSHGAALA